MSNQKIAAIVLLTTLLLHIYAETTATISCPALDYNIDPSNADLMNNAMLSAYSSFERNPAYSSANAEFSSVLNSAPASVTSSLYCSGYGDINISSLPSWLTPVPTAAVSIFLHEEQVYQSIVTSFVEKASREWSERSSTPESRIASNSSQITTAGLSVFTSPTSLATSTSSSAAASVITGSLASSILATASLILADLL